MVDTCYNELGFYHNNTARNGHNMSALRSVYGAEGYGWYWMLVEMMNQEENKSLVFFSTWDIESYAFQLRCDVDKLSKFIHDCIYEFNLFGSDDGSIWAIGYK